MEIEKSNSPTKEENINTKSGIDSQENSIFLSQLFGIKITQEEIDLFKDLGEISLFLNNIKFTDKKKNEVKDTISEELKYLQNKESLQKLTEEKNKKFSDIVKLNGKTIIYHTAEKDELSQTMHAFYFCDKSKQIFSDKQAAEYRAMHLDTGYELPIPINFGIKEEDNISSYSNLKTVNTPNDNIDKNSKLKKKRRPSTNIIKNSKSSKKQKTDRMNMSEDYNSKNGEGVAAQEADYCIPKCKYGRKSRNQPMIQCDKCREWYHTKCLSFTNEQFQKYDGKGKTWYCPECSKMDFDANNNEGINKI